MQGLIASCLLASQASVTHMKEDHRGMFFSQRPLPDGINPAIDPFHQPQGPGQTDYLSEWPRDRTGAIKRDAYETISHLCSFAFAACLETVVGQV